MARRAVRLAGAVLVAAAVAAGCSTAVAGHGRSGNGTAAGGGGPGSGSSDTTTESGQATGSPGGTGNGAEYLTVEVCSFLHKNTWNSLGKNITFQVSAKISYDTCDVDLAESHVGKPRTWRVDLDIGSSIPTAAEFAPAYGPVQTKQQSGVTVYTSAKDKLGQCLRAFNLPDGGPTMIIQTIGATACEAADLTLDTVLQVAADHSWMPVDPPLPATAAASADLCQQLTSAVGSILGASVTPARSGAHGCTWTSGQGSSSKAVLLSLGVQQWPPPLTFPGAKTGLIGLYRTLASAVPNPHGGTGVFAYMNLGVARVGTGGSYDVLTINIALPGSPDTGIQDATTLFHAIAALHLQ